MYYKIFIKLSALDVYKLSGYLLIYFKNNKVHPKIISLVKNLEQHSFKFLEEIIEDKLINIKKDTLIFPNYILLTTYFKDFILSKNNIKKNESITNIFNIENIKNRKNNIPSQQYNFYISMSNTEIDSKLLKINSKFFHNRSEKLYFTKQIFKLGLASLNIMKKNFSLIKKLLELDYSSDDKYSIDDF